MFPSGEIANNVPLKPSLVMLDEVTSTIIAAELLVGLLPSTILVPVELTSMELGPYGKTKLAPMLSGVTVVELAELIDVSTFEPVLPA